MYFEEGETVGVGPDERGGAGRSRKRHVPHPPAGEALTHPPIHFPGAGTAESALSPPRSSGDGAIRFLFITSYSIGNKNVSKRILKFY